MKNWYHVADTDRLNPGQVTIVTAGVRDVALIRTEEHGYTALDNRCPHQHGPLGEGIYDGRWLLCPWHGYEYDPATGEPPEGYGDCAAPLPLEIREDGIWVEMDQPEEKPTVSDQMVRVMTDWGVDTVFGMVGHSNLGFAEALRRAEEDGRLKYYGIRHEGAASFAASAYGKLTGRPAACFAIAGPGSTNMLTGLWDARVDRSPVLALSGQVDTQVLGPGAFQEIDLYSAFDAVRTWGQTLVTNENASELMALAIKHALVEQGVSHLILPNESQTLPPRDPAPETPREGRLGLPEILPPEGGLQEALALIREAKRPVIIAGNGARRHRQAVLRLAEKIDAPVISTFKAKGLVADAHPLGCGTLGRSGTPVGSYMMGKSDLLIVLGASFSVHTGISPRKKTIQVDFDRMVLGKFHPVTCPLWGEIGVTTAWLEQRLENVDRPSVREDLAARWDFWRNEKRRREPLRDSEGRLHPALVFRHLSERVDEDAVLCVDVGNNTYSFGRFFESKGAQDVLMSGYLGSIGFAFPAALGAWAAVGRDRQVVSISGDGGFGQYLAEFTTAVKYGMNICHILLNNGQLGKISKEQRAGGWKEWSTELVNPEFAAYARLCGGAGFRVTEPEQLSGALDEALGSGKPALVEILTDPRQT